MERGVIAKWLKKEGDKVEPGDALIEVSTDKATVEHAALDGGFLRKILVQEGSEADVNQAIAIFSEVQEESIEGYQPESIAAAPAAKEKSAPVVVPLVPSRQEERVLASPLAKKLAKEKGIDIKTVNGSGPRGRIVAKDLEKTAQPSLQHREIPLTPVRKVISERLQEAKSTIPHFYVSIQVDAEKLIEMREELSKLEVKISVNDCIIRAVALTLRKHPHINAGFNPETNVITQYGSIDISVAVSVPSGLITPIVFEADRKSLSEISQAVRGLAKKAKEGRLAPAEFQGGSFTISNLGMFGVSDFVAIINPPQAAILAVGSVLDRPIVKNGAVVPGKVMNLTLSADHRVVDGVAAAEFLADLKITLEQPLALLL